MALAFSSRHPNAAKAMNNWERKSSYLLREIVKFRTYIDVLMLAGEARKRVTEKRDEEEQERRGKEKQKEVEKEEDENADQTGKLDAGKAKA